METKTLARCACAGRLAAMLMATSAAHACDLNMEIVEKQQLRVTSNCWGEAVQYFYIRSRQHPNECPRVHLDEVERVDHDAYFVKVTCAVDPEPTRTLLWKFVEGTLNIFNTEEW